MRPRGPSLTLKIFLGTALVVIVIVAVTLAVTARSATMAADESVNRVLATAREAVATQLSSRADRLRGAARIFVTNPQPQLSDGGVEGAVTSPSP